MSHPEKLKEKAYIAFTQCRTVEGTARLLELHPSTVRKWKLKYDWEVRLENDKALLVQDPFAENQNVEQFIGQFNVGKEDAEVMRQIVTLEGVCWACIKDEVPVTQINLQPKSLKEATDILNRCWNMRERLLHPERRQGQTSSIQVNAQQADFITGTVYGENAPKQEQKMVSGQMPDSEYDR